jgi:hypothetical protein
MTDKLSPRFTLTCGDTQTEIFMSFGLLNTLSGIFENPQQISETFTNPTVRLDILLLCLSKRDKYGKITEEFAINELEIDADHLIDFLDWVESHISYFFLRAWEKAIRSTKKRTEDIKKNT